MNEPVYIVAGGPSLSSFDFSLLEGRDVITINNAAFKVPAAKYVYFTDHDWYQRWHPQLKEHTGTVIKGTLPDDNTPVDSWVDVWYFTGETGLSLEPRTLRHGNNSGYAAINLAVQLGYKTVYLLGYDMGYSADGKPNFHADHERITPADCYPKWLLNFETLVVPLQQIGVSVINLTPTTALTSFPRERFQVLAPQQ